MEKVEILNRVNTVDVQRYIREQLEDMIFILGLGVSACVGREWAIESIKDEVKKL
jgi:hypothetical protein